ncbi:MAG: hypothetical protein JWN86_115 [Planctomycetota bacterium]|nr:hypothetical protein [Planctomycetota bacterium]
MSAVVALLGPFLIYWLILFVACLAVIEFGQSYLYDESTPSAGLKAALGSAIFAVILTWSRPEYHTMFTANLGKTVVLAVVAFAVFTLVFRFQPWHALPIGLITVLLVSGLGTMGIESFANRNRPLSATVKNPGKPIRHSTTTLPTRTIPVPGPVPTAK